MSITNWEILHKLSQIPELPIEFGEKRLLHIESWLVEKPECNKPKESESDTVGDTIQLTVKIDGKIYQLGTDGYYLGHEGIDGAFNTLGKFPNNPIDLGDGRELLISQWAPSIDDWPSSSKPYMLNITIEGSIVTKKGEEQ